ncbi:hypothetical protein Herbaro_20160 [Herbaspirillum sp. WKF16]|uniref:hypothetical protein n=1 Tax=Herbaspirillum sp. WKF16 TaxID=3028312 RepID=UPI0023A94644|nr:hypothetical protein [Herbaspirillum sp. WKF16]WDZ95764.1 hypothetical protein Herbaro_20160 [Herbaspirillum sp. WKF16]
MSSVTLQDVPADFPRSRHLASVGGAQPKASVRLVQGRFLEGWTDTELIERFDACHDLVEQLTPFCREKLASITGSTTESLLPRVRKGVLNKGWDLTDAELDWIFARLKSRLAEP